MLLETVFRVPLDKLTVLPAETVFTLSKSEKLLSRIQGLSLSSQESQLLFKQLTDVNAQGFRQALVQNEKLVDAWLVLNNIGESLATNKIVSLDKTVRTAVSNLGNRPLESKILNVVMHSDGESFLINGIPMSHRILVKYIKKTQSNFEMVRLLSCKAGAEIGAAEKRILAQDLANNLNKKVDASPETVWIHGDGKITTGKNAAENTDNWNQYSPGNGEVKKTSVDKSKIKGAAGDAVALGAGADDILTIFVNNYKVTLTGKIAEFVTPTGDIFGRLYKQGQGGDLQYSFKYKAQDGNLKTFNKLKCEVYDDFIEFDFNIPTELKGKGLGSVVFRDALKYYEIKVPNFKGVRARWEANNPNYNGGKSENFKQFESARKTESPSDSAFKTWTGAQAKKANFIKAKVVTEESTLIIVEFTK